MSKILEMINWIHYKLFWGDYVTLVIVLVAVCLLVTAIHAAPAKRKLLAFTLTEDVTIKAKLKDELVELSAHKGNIIYLEAEVNKSSVAMGE